MKKQFRKYFTLNFKADEPFPLPDDKKDYALYIHIPYCRQLCPYCSFFKTIFNPSQAAVYLNALRKELLIYKDRGFIFRTIYIGGGTPTLLFKELVELVDLMKKIWPIQQISMETNPEHLNQEILGLLQYIGVTRLSVGVQTFNSSLLEQLQRRDNQGTGEETIEKLIRFREAFPTLNVDMMFNFPNQTHEMLREDLYQISQVNPSQVTYYPLMLSGTAGRDFQVNYGSMNYRQEKQYYRIILNQLQKQYTQVSTWCFSKNDSMIDEYIIDHNEYVGAGAGAFSYLDGSIYVNNFSISAYIKKLQQNTPPQVAYIHFKRQQKIHYYFLMKLFSGRINLQELKIQFKDTLLPLKIEQLFFILTGAGKIQNKHLILTPRGKYFVLIMMREFFTGVNHLRESALSAPSALRYIHSF